MWSLLASHLIVKKRPKRVNRSGTRRLAVHRVVLFILQVSSVFARYLNL